MIAITGLWALISMPATATCSANGRLPCRCARPITKISRSGLHLMRDRWRNRNSADFRLGMAVETDTDPRDFGCPMRLVGPVRLRHRPRVNPGPPRFSRTASDTAA